MKAILIALMFLILSAAIPAKADGGASQCTPVGGKLCKP
jgi:hypothetical protein